MKKLFAKIRQFLFESRTEREIKLKIIPQIKGRAQHGYPFSTSGKLHMKRIEGSMQFREKLRELDSTGLQMPEDEANALLFIAYRDLGERMNAYIELARAHKELRAPIELQPVVVAA